MTTRATHRPGRRDRVRSRRKLTRIIVLAGVIFFLTVTWAWTAPHFLRPAPDHAAGAYVYAVPSEPGLITPDVYGTDLSVELYAEPDQNFFQQVGVAPSHPIISIWGQFSIPSSSATTGLLRWDVYLPQGTKSYRYLSRPAGGGSEPSRIEMGSWNRVDPDERLVRVPVGRLTHEDGGGRDDLILGVQIIIDPPVVSAKFGDHGWTQAWRIGWYAPSGAPLMPNWNSVGERPPEAGADLWWQNPDVYSASRYGQVNLFSCSTCEANSSFGDAKELSTSLFAVGADANQGEMLEVAVPWMPWSWVSSVSGWVLIGSAGIALTAAVSRWGRRALLAPAKPNQE